MASSRPDAPRPNPRPEAPRPENPLPREVGVGCRIVREELGQTVKKRSVFSFLIYVYRRLLCHIYDHDEKLPYDHKFLCFVFLRSFFYFSIFLSSSAVTMGDFFCLTVCPRGKWYSLKVSHFPTSLNNLNCAFAYSDTGLLPGNNCVLCSMRFGNKYFPLEF